MVYAHSWKELFMVELFVFTMWVILLTPCCFLMRCMKRATHLNDKGLASFVAKYGRKPKWYEINADDWRDYS